jgi:hypothetical protein
MKKRLSVVAAAVVALAALSGCTSGDVLGGGSRTAGIQEVRGSVDHVDSRNRVIVLRNAEVWRSGIVGTGGGGTTVSVHYDDRTPVKWEGRTYRPEDLERGDQLMIRAEERSGRLQAIDMTVTYNVSAPGTASPGGTGSFGNTVRGNVRNVDVGRRTIDIDRGSFGGSVIVEYDNSSFVEHSGRRYNPDQLQRGDEIEVTVRDLGRNRLMAERIVVVRDIGIGQGGGTMAPMGSDVRGTVRTVDTGRRTIELEQASWSSRFAAGSGTSSVVLLQFENSTRVEYQGQQYAPSNLERGDVIDVQVRDLGRGSLLAERIWVVRNVRDFR